MTVPVTAHVRDETFQALAVVARARGITEGQLLAALANDAAARMLERMSKPRRTVATRYTDAERTRMLELHTVGLTDAQIAKQVGRSQPGVSRHLRTLGLPANGTRIGSPAKV